MLTLTVEWPGLTALVADLQALRNVDLFPVAEQCEQIIVEGNRRGVLAGLDGNNHPMPHLKYRGGAGKKTRNRRVPDYGTNLFQETGHGPLATGLHDNLSLAEYQKLTGPRLAPRREQSRIIKNLLTRIDHPTDDEWEAIGAWVEVVDVEGRPFLRDHFDGIGQARYDLRPIRDEDMQFCRNALEAFANQDFFRSI